MNSSHPSLSILALLKTPFIFTLSTLKTFARQTYYSVARAYVFARTGDRSLTTPWKNVLFVGDLNQMHIGRKTQFDQDVVITCKNQSELTLNDGVKVGSRCSFSANLFSKLIVKKNTSFHSDCSLVGDIQIGRSCLFARNIFVSSFDHQFQKEPALFIKEQDRKYPPASKPVVIDDDCWIGWGVAIRSGLHIGKGVVVGANSVVTKDLKPYRIYGGIPAKEIGIRLDFRPPAQLLASNPDHSPYFYSDLEFKNQAYVSDGLTWSLGAPVLATGQIMIKTLNSANAIVHLLSSEKNIQGQWKDSETLIFNLKSDDLNHILMSESYTILDFKSEQPVQIKEVIYPC